MTETPNSPENATDHQPPGVPSPLDHHGGARPRGLDTVPHSSTDTGRYGRLFRTLPALNLTDEQYRAVAAQMEEATLAPGWGNAPGQGDNPTLPAGYTYLAQFVDHDITFDPVSVLGAANDPDALANFRTPRFDLDSLYGGGPKVSPWLYDQSDPDKLLVHTNPGTPGNETLATRDLPRNEQGRALVGDPRNDVHAIVAQLHLAFSLFHNAVVDKVRADPTLVGGAPATPAPDSPYNPANPAPSGPTVTFAQICTLVRWHYQWLVLRDLLPRLVGADVANAVLVTDKKGRLKTDLKLYSVRRNAWMPVEFSGAAYRFGHSLVRDAYQLNATSGAIPVFSASPTPGPVEDLRGFRPLVAALEVQWHRFFDALPSSGPETQTSRLFDTHLAASLSHLPTGIDTERRPLALLNLFRGQALGLPSGEDVAIAVSSATGTPALSVSTGLPHPSPLWFWLLKEAETGGGNQLGPVGGRIVAEVLVGLAAKDPSGFLRARPDWKPNLVGTDAFTMADLLTIAGVQL